MTYTQVYNQYVEKLKQAGILDADSDVRLLFYYGLNLSRSDLFMKANEEMPDEDIKKLSKMAEQRVKRIPLQHITGVQEFMGLEFLVSKDVLIPRFDTETLVEEAMLFCNDSDRVLDVCTGSGCIIISLMKYKNGIKGYGCDISKEALQIAEKNKKKLFNEEDSEDMADNYNNLTFIESDLFSNINEREFDIIVSNPPYIKDEVIKTLMPEVKDHDPYIALSGGEDGLIFYRRIISEARDYLVKGGRLLLEIGHDQGMDVYNLFIDNGYTDVEIKKDLAKNDRVVTGRYLCSTN